MSVIAEYINKIIFGGKVLIDLTEDTVTEETLAKGVTAHDATGKQITGTLEASSASNCEFVCDDGSTIPIGNIYLYDPDDISEIAELVGGDA